MLTYQEPEPVLEQLRALDKQDYVAFANFGAATAAPAAGKQQPFYLAADPVAAFMKALQRTLGVPVTGNWDRATHEAVMAWAHADELRQQAEGSSAPLTVIPAWGQPWTLESDPTSTSIENTAALAGDAIGHYAERVPAFAQALGFASAQAMNNDSQWLLNKDAIVTAIISHIAAQETAAAAVVVAECPPGKYKDATGRCVDVPPTVEVRPVVQKAWYKRPSTWLVAGGGVLLLGLLVAVARRKD